MKNKHKCCCCGQVATWYDEYGTHRGRYYCDECIPRGSISNVANIDDFGEPTRNTNIMWWDKNCVAKDLLKNGSLERNENSFYYEELDKLGRRNPHDDFVCCADGFDITDKRHKKYVTWENIIKSIDNNCLFMTYRDIFKIKDAISDIFLNYRDEFTRNQIIYNVLMSKIGIYLSAPNADFSTTPLTQKNIKAFYENFKKELRKNTYS